MGRPRKWTPKKVGCEDVEEAEGFTKEYMNSISQELRVQQDFILFRELNPDITTVSGILLMWVGSMRRAGMMWSSMDTYLNFLKSGGLLKTSMADDRYSVSRIIKAVKIAHADAECKQAADIDLATALKIIDQCPEELKCAVWLMLLTGARNADLRRVRRTQLHARGKRMIVQFRVMKNRRVRSRRVNLVLEDVKLWTGICATPFHKILSAIPENEKVVQTTVHQLNRYLQQFGATSYSLRRHYIRRVIHVCERDFERVKTKTLHLDADVVRAHYDSFKQVLKGN